MKEIIILFLSLSFLYLGISDFRTDYKEMAQGVGFISFVDIMLNYKDVFLVLGMISFYIARKKKLIHTDSLLVDIVETILKWSVTFLFIYIWIFLTFLLVLE